MIEARYEFLRTIDDIIEAPEANTLGRKSSKLTLDNNTITIPGSVLPHRGSSSQGSKKGTFAPPPKPAITTEVQDSPTHVPGHVMLWKSATLQRLEKMRIHKEMIVNMEPDKASLAMRALLYQEYHSPVVRRHFRQRGLYPQCNTEYLGPCQTVTTYGSPRRPNRPSAYKGRSKH